MQPDSPTPPSVKPTVPAGWVGGFEETNPNFSYPKADLTTLPLLDNLTFVRNLQRQQKAYWPEFTWLTDPTAAPDAAPNRLLGQPAPAAPNRVWVGDITCLPRQGGGWLYLAVWLDRCSRKIMSWDVRDTMPEYLVSEAWRWALVVRRPLAGLVVHSGQGSQYTATRFKQPLARYGAR